MLGGRIVFGLYGAGGFGREVMPIAKEHLYMMMERFPSSSIEMVFIEDQPRFSLINNYRVISEDEFFALDCDERLFNVSVAASDARCKISARCIDRGAKPISIQATQALVYDNNQIGPGAILCANTMVTSNATIGAFFHANIYSYVAHDCVIGDFVTFAPSVHCNGNVHIKDHAYIGTGATIKQGTPDKPLVIGEGAIVGMGAVVTKDVPPHATVVGNPAAPLRSRPSV